MPTAVLRVLTGYRLLGPHLRMTSRWRHLQDCVDAALLRARASEGVDAQQVASPSMEELMRRWEEAHASSD